MPQLWLVIGITCLASTGNNVGKVCFASKRRKASDTSSMQVSTLCCLQVLQKDATRQLPRFSFHAKTAKQYLSSRQWVLGLAFDVGGALLMIAAYATAPVSEGVSLKKRMLVSLHCHT